MLQRGQNRGIYHPPGAFVDAGQAGPNRAEYNIAITRQKYASRTHAARSGGAQPRKQRGQGGAKTEVPA